MKTLRDVMPSEVEEWTDIPAHKFLDIEVISVHENYWIGPHKNVYHWVKLANGYAVAWNENPARGWSFPVVKIKKET